MTKGTEEQNLMQQKHKNVELAVDELQQIYSTIIGNSNTLRSMYESGYNSAMDDVLNLKAIQDSPYIKELIEQLKSGEIDSDELIKY